MTLVWNIKLYNTGGAKTPWRVKIEGNPGIGQAWVFSDGKGRTPAEAYDAATLKMVVKPWLIAAP